jgi:hypothetical protein
MFKSILVTGTKYNCCCQLLLPYCCHTFVDIPAVLPPITHAIGATLENLQGSGLLPSIFDVSLSILLSTVGLWILYS